MASTEHILLMTRSRETNAGDLVFLCYQPPTYARAVQMLETNNVPAPGITIFGCA